MPRDREQIRSSLLRKGFVPKGGDHDFLIFEHKGLLRAILTKLSRGSGYKVYNDVLLGKMSKQLQVTRAQLNELIDCPMEKADYVQHLKSRGFLR